MYIVKKINEELYPCSDLIFERKYIPCFCKIKPDCFEITFRTDRLENIKLEVSEFNIDQIGLYSATGVGGQWWMYDDALVTLRRNPDNPNRLEFIDLAFFDLFAGWFWAIKDGKYTEDYVGKDDEEYLNRVIYPLQD